MTESAPAATVPLSSDQIRRFGAVGRLLGSAALDRLAAARVCVIGLGGVGSWTVEALARSGVGALTLVDFDEVCVTNVNRQLPALTETVGRPKAQVLAERVAGINPACRVEPVVEFFTKENFERLLAPRYDFVVDATDSLQHKLLAIWQCRERGLPVLTVGASAGKRDGTRVRAADLCESASDALLRFVRKRLRERHGFPRAQGEHFGVRCVFSPEPPVYPWADGRVCATQEAGSAAELDCENGLGSATFVTGAFGFAAAGEVVRLLTTPPGGDPHQE
jgi:tRNA A37 threonylcarbamoyladenosine dehydratase